MDLIQKLGPLALTSRLRRLTERLYQDVTNIYKEQTIDFEPRWFPAFYLLASQPESEPMAVVDIAKNLGVTHPAVNQIAGELIKAGLVIDLKDKTDGRKRLLSLSDEGRALYPRLEKIWTDVQQAAIGFVNATGYDVLHVIECLEESLEEASIYKRYQAVSRLRQLDQITIHEYRPAYKDDFRRLNIAWIEKYFAVEPEDIKVLNHPDREIIKKGGQIFFAEYHGTIVGTCAIKPLGNETYELCKMGVDESVRGHQIGKKLLAAAIEKAIDLGGVAMVLDTNSKLIPAINLYRSFGFVVIPEKDKPATAHYDRTDTAMHLDLTQSRVRLQPAGVLAGV